MAEEKRTYSKVSLERELLPQHKNTTIGAEVQQVSIQDIKMTAYQKPDVEEMPKAFFVIISGGEVREKDYFRILSNQDKFKRIKLEFIADPLKLSPVGMFDTAEYKKARYLSSKNEDAEPDKIYLISDMDHFMDELIRIKPKCKSEGLHLVISNSCFEVWLYYAHRDEVPNFPIPTERLKISSKFKGWLPGVIPGGIKPIKSILNIYPNIENAKKNYKEDENGIPLLFSTNMYLLAEELLPLIEPELTRMIAENKTKEADFRSKKKK